ncbi:hypothetical protein ACJMK2_036322 [Sinanodonta woodiana]|uniref:BRISC and BRCA1-A complex member 2 n=1 Tax=Sinanodonta woodiana TaxID=1069815 RepID=A0ABD3WGW1_SINWO
MSINKLEILDYFAPSLRKFLRALLEENSIGICAGKTSIVDRQSSCTTLEQSLQPCCDRFQVLIPYAGVTLTWEVLFDCNQPDEPPDFIFAPEDSNFFPRLGDLPGLVCWNHKDPNSLVRVLKELLDQYKIYQENLISSSSRLKFEYSDLLTGTDLKPENIEIHAARKEKKIGPINFLMKLSVDFSRIPEYLLNCDPGRDTALLLVTFNSPDGHKIIPQLYLSPRVERALGGSSNLRIPAFPNGSCLTEYVLEVYQLLKNKVDQTVQAYEKRKEYVAAFLSQHTGAVLEYDMEGFTKCSFLFEWHDFFFILYVDIPAYFPKEQPILTLQSIYHLNKGKPYSDVFKEYPYSPRWNRTEMVERTRNYILDNIKAFQKSSVLSGS